jgi:hypothetical protein
MGAAAETAPKHGCGGGSVLAHGWVPQRSVYLLGVWCAMWGLPEMVVALQGATREVGRGGMAHAADLWGPFEGPQVQMHSLGGMHPRLCMLGMHCTASGTLGLWAIVDDAAQ